MFNKYFGWVRWLKAIILAIWKAEVWRITVGDSPGKKFRRPYLT
jgi:hypothetical protein